MKTFTMSINVAILLAAISLTGCASQNIEIQSDTANANNPELMQAFEVKYRAVIKEIQNDSSYKRIPLAGNKDLKWFNTMAFQLWDKQITKDQFVSEGLGRFPDYKKSFEYLANKFLN